MTSVKLHSHADTAIPASRDEADGLCNDWRVEYVGHYAVLVSVGLKVLKKNQIIVKTLVTDDSPSEASELIAGI